MCDQKMINLSKWSVVSGLEVLIQGSNRKALTLIISIMQISPVMQMRW